MPDPSVGRRDPSRPVGEVRSELQRLGYLDHQVERYLLQDAFRPRRPLLRLAQMAGKVGALIGLPITLVLTLALAAANGHLKHSPLDVLPLFAHLLLPVIAVLGLLFIVFAGLLTAAVHWTHTRRIEVLSFSLAMVAATAWVSGALWQGRLLVADLSQSVIVGLLLLIPALAYGLFTVIHGGLLSLAIQLTEVAPEKRSSHGRWWVAAMVLAVFLVMLPAGLRAVWLPAAIPAAPNLPETIGDRVLVLGVDGVLPQELDFLLASGELQGLSSLLSGGGVVLRYERPPVEPITFWTTVATGLDSARHGLESLDTYRPLGVSRPLRHSGWLRAYWDLLAPTWVEYQPLLASQRNAWAFWELASRGGARSLVIDWWGTFPAQEHPGRLIAHGAYQMLDEQARGVVFPEDLAPALKRRADRATLPDALQAGLTQVLGETSARDLMQRALLPDTFYSAELQRGVEELSPRLAALYLPGLDIAADSALGSVALSELVRWQLRGLDVLLASQPGSGVSETISSLRQEVAIPGYFQTIIVIVDPGRREATEGRAILWRSSGCQPSGDAGDSVASEATVQPEELTSAILRALGIAQSAELPEPPEVCPWPLPAMRVDTFGARHTRRSDIETDDYLESLQSLGYL